MSGASMPSTRQQLGRFGEAAAAAHILRQGGAIIARNWRCPGGELDLVAQLGGQLVFVEVRTRRASAVAPEESITPVKARRLIGLAHSYLSAGAFPADTPWRIDVIAVVLDSSGRITRLSQIESAVEGG
jgi:putative endonuclease